MVIRSKSPRDAGTQFERGVSEKKFSLKQNVKL
jgi:hypothetical protein